MFLLLTPSIHGVAMRPCAQRSVSVSTNDDKSAINHDHWNCQMNLNVRLRKMASNLTTQYVHV
jgi:hypothetical protein